SIGKSIEDGFVLKLDPNGNFLWADDFGGSGAQVNPYGGIATDAAGTVYVTGLFTGKADFNPGAGSFTLTSQGRANGFVVKLDGAGNFGPAAQLGAGANVSPGAVAVDGTGDVFVTGGFYGTGDFDPTLGKYLLTSASAWNWDVFVVKLT